MTDRNANHPGYKKTKVGWIPEEWDVTKLASTSKIIMGQSPNSEFYNEVGEGLPLIQGMSDIKDGKTQPRYWTTQITKECHPDDIILSVRAPVGNVARSIHHGCIGRGVCVVRSKKSSDFIFQLLKYMEPVWARYSQGSTFEAVVSKDVKQFPVPNPPYPEQKRIAEILNTWDRAIEQTRQLIDAKQRLKKGLMQQLLTGRMRFPGFGAPVEKAGELPEGWEEKTLGDMGTFSKGANIQKSDLVDEGIPCIRYGEIYTVHDFILKEFKSYISSSTAMSSKRIYKGDILFAGSGETREEIGKCIAYVDEYEAYAGGDVIIFRSNESNPYYLGYLLNHPLIIKQKSALGQGYSIFHIYPNMLKKLIIHLPPRNEQKMIVHVISTLDNEILRLVKLTKFLNLQKLGLLQKLLSGEVRV